MKKLTDIKSIAALRSSLVSSWDEFGGWSRGGMESRRFGRAALNGLFPPDSNDFSRGLEAEAFSQIRFFEGEGCDMCARPFVVPMPKGGTL